MTTPAKPITKEQLAAKAAELASYIRSRENDIPLSQRIVVCTRIGEIERGLLSLQPDAPTVRPDERLPTKLPADFPDYLKDEIKPAAPVGRTSTEETPRTDAAEKFGNASDECDFVHMSFARQLERELNEALENNRLLEKAVRHHASRSAPDKADQLAGDSSNEAVEEIVALSQTMAVAYSDEFRRGVRAILEQHLPRPDEKAVREAIESAAHAIILVYKDYPRTFEKKKQAVMDIIIDRLTPCAPPTVNPNFLTSSQTLVRPTKQTK